MLQRVMPQQDAVVTPQQDTLVTRRPAGHVTDADVKGSEVGIGFLIAVADAVAVDAVCSRTAEFTTVCSAAFTWLTRRAQATLVVTSETKQVSPTSIAL